MFLKNGWALSQSYDFDFSLNDLNAINLGQDQDVESTPGFVAQCSSAKKKRKMTFVVWQYFNLIETDDPTGNNDGKGTMHILQIFFYSYK